MTEVTYPSGDVLDPQAFSHTLSWLSQASWLVTNAWLTTTVYK